MHFDEYGLAFSSIFHIKPLEKKLEICYNMLWGMVHVVGELRRVPKKHDFGGYFMKMKSVLAAVIAAATVSCTSVCAFAETANTDETSEASENGSSVASATEADDPIEKGNPNSGVEGVAMVAGIAMVAGAALVVSHKHDR